MLDIMTQTSRYFTTISLGILFCISACKPSADTGAITESSVEGQRQSVESSVEQKAAQSNSSGQVDLPFSFDNADRIIILDKELIEISGLTYDTKRDRLLAINDEQGYVYIIDEKSGTSIKYLEFGKDKDYEGLVRTSEGVIVLESDGDLNLVNIQAKTTDLRKTGLTSRTDAEGLSVLPDGRLLIACKGFPKGELTTGRKVIYAYDIAKKKLSEYISIDDKTLSDMAKEKYAKESKNKERKRIARAIDFSPSGVAYDSSSGYTYIVSAKGNTLVVVDQKGALADLVMLPKRTMPQVEAITFDPDGNLYIATEGQGLTAKVFVYNRRK